MTSHIWNGKKKSSKPPTRHPWCISVERFFLLQIRESKMWHAASPCGPQIWPPRAPTSGKANSRNPRLDTHLAKIRVGLWLGLPIKNCWGFVVDIYLWLIYTKIVRKSPRSTIVVRHFFGSSSYQFCITDITPQNLEAYSSSRYTS